MQRSRWPRAPLAGATLATLGLALLLAACGPSATPTASPASGASGGVSGQAPSGGPTTLVHATWASHPETLAERIDNAGAVFLGHHSPVAVGDYVAGPSHVLPTGGTARFMSGLSANDFLRRSSVLSFTDQGLAAMADDVRVLAAKEGLTAHAASVDIRLERGTNP